MTAAPATVGRTDQGLDPVRLHPDVHRRVREDRLDRGRGEFQDLLPYLGGILLRQKAYVDVYCAIVGNFVQGVSAPDSTEVDRWTVEQFGTLPRKR